MNNFNFVDAEYPPYKLKYPEIVEGKKTTWNHKLIYPTDWRIKRIYDKTRHVVNIYYLKGKSIKREQDKIPYTWTLEKTDKPSYKDRKPITVDKTIPLDWGFTDEFTTYCSSVDLKVMEENG